MMLYHLLRLLKFSGVLLFGGGAVASFVASSQAERKRAVHGVASPGLALTWFSGYALTLELGIPLAELWVLGGLSCSFLAELTLVRSAALAGPSRRHQVSAALLLALTLVLMVFRPTWAQLKS